MSKAEFNIDSEQVLKMFSEFNKKQRKKTFRTAIIRSLQIVKKQALTNLESVVDADKINFKDKWGTTLKKEIKTKVYKDTSGGIAHIMSKGAFKLRFFELGTNDRFTSHWRGHLLKKKRYTGKIKASHFFSRAKESKEREVFSTIEKHLIDAITKINNKYKNGKRK